MSMEVSASLQPRRGSVSPEPAAVPGDLSRRPARRVAAAVLGLLVAIFVAQGLRVASTPPVNIVSWNVVIDDGFYYLQIARNIARGHGSTFDRVNPTNGYQPLWALALVPIFFFTDDPLVGMQAMLILSALLGGLGMTLLYLGLSRLAGIGAALLTCALIVSNPYFLKIMQSGLETALLFAAIAGLVAAWALRGGAALAGDRRAGLLLGTTMALTVLARLDLALALAPFVLLFALWGRGGGLALRARRLGLIALPGLMLLGPYLLWNVVVHGGLVPVSGLVKQWVAETFQPTWELFVVTEQWRGLTRTLHHLRWPFESDGIEMIGQIPQLLRPAAWLLLLLGARLIWSRRARHNGRAIVLLAAATVGVALHGLYLFFVYRSAGHWNYHYFFPLALLVTVLLALSGPLLLADGALLLDRLVRGRLRPGFAALGAALALLPAGWILQRGLASAEARQRELLQPTEASFRRCRWEAAGYIRQSFPREAVFGAWWAGTLGYLSDRRVVNLDGVVNSRDFLERYLKPDLVDRYVVETPIRHLVDFFWRDPLSPAPPGWRNFYWEHDKEHIVHRLRRRLRRLRAFHFQGAQATYVLEVLEAPRGRVP